MADLPNTAIRQFAISNSGWTAIVTPIACNYWSLGNSSGAAFLRASDPNNAAAQYQVPALAWYSMLAPGPSVARDHVRYQPGSTVTYAKGIGADTGPIIAEFVL